MTTPRKPFAKVEDTGFHAMLKRVVAEELAQIEADYAAAGLSAYAGLARVERTIRAKDSPQQPWTPWNP